MAKKSPSDSPRAPRRRAMPTVGPGAAEATQGVRSAVATDASAEMAASEQEIARRAYEIYTERGGRDGYDLDDWLQAERELRESRDRR